MARDAVAIIAAALHTATNQTTGDGTAINVSNGAKVTPTNKCSSLLLRVSNTITNATKTVTIAAGDNPPSARAALGALTLTVPASGDIVTTIESARFMQDDGTISLDFGAGMTGYVWAVQLADGAA